MTKLGTGLSALLLLASGCGWKLTPRDSSATDPSADAAPTLAASFSLPGDDGVFVSLDDLLATGRPAVIVFYRGHW